MNESNNQFLEENAAIFNLLNNPYKLMAEIIYGGGLRLLEESGDSFKSSRLK